MIWLLCSEGGKTTRRPGYSIAVTKFLLRIRGCSQTCDVSTANDRRPTSNSMKFNDFVSLMQHRYNNHLWRHEKSGKISNSVLIWLRTYVCAVQQPARWTINYNNNVIIVPTIVVAFSCSLTLVENAIIIVSKNTWRCTSSGKAIWKREQQISGRYF